MIVTKKRKKMPPIDPKFIVNSELLPKKCELTEFNGIDNKSQNDSQPIDKQESKQNLTLENESTTEKKETNSGQIKEKKIKGKEIKENFLKIQVKGEGEKFENLEFDRWRKELLDDEDWCATLVRFSENDEGYFSPTQRRLYMPEEARQAIINSKAMAWLLKREFDAP